MKSDRSLFIVTVVGSILFFTAALQWSLHGTISRDGIITLPNYQAGLFLFLFVVVGGGLLRFHPRYGGIYPAYQRAYDFVLFTGVLNTPTLLLTPSAIEAGNSRTDNVILWISFLTIFYFGYSVLIPLLFQRKRYALVHRTLDVMQRIRPRNANLFITRGRTFYAQKDFENAIQAVDHAITLTPPLKKKDEEGWLNFKDWRLIHAHEIRMFAYFSLDQQEMAFEDAEILVRLNPDEALGYINRAAASARRDDFTAAEADLDYANQLKLDPRRQAYLIAAWGDLAYLQHKNDDARSVYQAALDITLPHQQRMLLHPAIYSMLSLIELREGHLEAAQEFCQEAQITNPEFKAIGIVFIHAQRGEWDEAVKQWRLIVVQSPHYGNLESMRRVYRSDPPFLDLIEQIIARAEPLAA